MRWLGVIWGVLCLLGTLVTVGLGFFWHRRRAVARFRRRLRHWGVDPEVAAEFTEWYRGLLPLRELARTGRRGGSPAPQEGRTGGG